MNCIEYIENFLSAHADGELSPGELRDAEQHLRQCLGCRGRLDDERALKSLVRQHIEMRAIPAAMRQQLLDALDRAASEDESASDAGAPAQPAHRLLKRRAAWVPLAVAAMLAIVFAVARRFESNQSAPTEASAPVRNPDFDIAIAALDRFQRGFAPNVPSDSAAALSAAYARAKMPDFIWNFGASGFKLAGGRLEKLDDGRKATYTLYRGAQNSILCTRFRNGGAAPPANPAKTLSNHRFYRYRGYSVCYTRLPDGGFVCILASRISLDRMVQAVKIALK